MVLNIIIPREEILIQKALNETFNSRDCIRIS